MMNKVPTEKERELLKELRKRPIEAEEIIETLSIKEIRSLYDKIDAVREEEGKTKLDLNVIDEEYLFEWRRVKGTLRAEYLTRLQARRKRTAFIGLVLILISTLSAIISLLAGSIMLLACTALVASIGALACSVANYKYDSATL